MPDRHLWYRHAQKTITLTGASGLGAVGTVPVFTITGRVMVTATSIFCTTDLTEAGATAAITFGVAASTGLFVASPTGGATDIDAGKFWLSTAPGAGISTTLTNKFISENPILTVATQNVTGGVLVFDMFYVPLTDGAKLV